MPGLPSGLPFALGGGTAVTTGAAISGSATAGKLIRDLRLDPTTGDLDVSGGDIQVVEGAESIRQHLSQRLQFFQGEWFLDLEAGLPYFQSILVKNPNPNLLRAVFKAEIEATPGVTSLSSFTLDYQPGARTLTVDYSAGTDVGEITGSVEV